MNCLNRKASLILFLALALSACKSDSAPPEPSPTPEATQAAPTKTPEATPKAARAVEDPRTPFEFAQGWADVFTSKESKARYRKADALGKAWEGKIYTWTGYAAASLCVDKERSCAINVFERTKTPSPARLGGFYPRVQFSAVGWSSLRKGCAGEAQCVVTFKGRLALAQTDLDKPLKLDFVDAEVTQTRQPVEGEVWFRSQVKWELPKGVEKRSPSDLRTGKPTVVDVKKLGIKRKTF